MSPAVRDVAEGPARFDLPGGPLDVTLRRSSRARRVRVTVDPSRGVVVTVPAGRGAHGASLRAAAAFLTEREGWVRRHLAAQQRALASSASAVRLADGATIRYRGLPHRLTVKGASARVRRSSIARVGGDVGDELVLTLAPRDDGRLADVLRGWLKERARREIQRAIDRHAGHLGVRPAAVSIRDQRARWGSASRSGRLSFSWRLVLAPPEALETVVVHELAHLRVFGHGAAFWELVASRVPDHLRWRRWLREHSTQIHLTLEEPRPSD